MLDGKDYVVATIGHLILTPNAPNAVPGRVEMLLEVRSDAAAVLETFVEDVMSTVRPDVEALGLVLTSTQVSHSLPTDCTPFMVDLIEQAAGALGYASMRMPSGAGQDRKSTRLNSSHYCASRMPSSA